MTVIYHYTIPHLLHIRVQIKMVWLGLLPLLIMLIEFILGTEAAHILLANFTGPVIILVIRKLQEWKCP